MRLTSRKKRLTLTGQPLRDVDGDASSHTAPLPWRYCGAGDHAGLPRRDANCVRRARGRPLSDAGRASSAGGDRSVSRQGRYQVGAAGARGRQDKRQLSGQCPDPGTADHPGIRRSARRRPRLRARADGLDRDHGTQDRGHVGPGRPTPRAKGVAQSGDGGVRPAGPLSPRCAARRSADRVDPLLRSA